jgi:hypothetical protein
MTMKYERNGRIDMMRTQRSKEKRRNIADDGKEGERRGECVEEKCHMSTTCAMVLKTHDCYVIRVCQNIIFLSKIP